jgi:activator of 2-hydroxyglutaryl-CoA dehydratase
LDDSILLPPWPQLAGAYGAALLAREQIAPRSSPSMEESRP